MSSQTVTYCVDTNLLVEFISLETIPWHDLVPDAEGIRIIVPTKVGEEMDEHKNKSGRLRRRAIEFSQLSRRMEDSQDGVIVLRSESPRVTIEFGPLFRKSELDGDRFELEDPDNRIVAEVAAIANSIPGTTLLADDSKPIRLARQAGLPYLRPLPEWRRQEGPDERDTEIQELKREIGARPLLTVSMAEPGDEGEMRQVLMPAPDACEAACSSAFRSAVLELDPQVPREELIERHGLVTPGRFEILYINQGLTENSLQRYDETYREFEQKVTKVAAGLARSFDFYGISLPLTIVAGNTGDRAAERVQVTAEVTAPFYFLPPDIIEDALSSLIDPPDPPEGNNHNFAALTQNFRHFEREVRRPDTFYAQDTPDRDATATFLSWRCEELRQSESHDLPVLVATEEPSAAGLLTVTIGSAVIAKPTVIRVPLSTGPAPDTADPKFFLRRLRHIPYRYRNLFSQKLQA
jgi:hypothetical protein